VKNAKLFKDGDIFIKSMEELIKRYQKAIELGISKSSYEDSKGMQCLLCNPINAAHNRDHYINECPDANPDEDYDIACKLLGCPWIVILGMTCHEFSDMRNMYSNIYHNCDPDIMKNRIRQIRNWIKIYKAHMESLKEK